MITNNDTFASLNTKMFDKFSEGFMLIGRDWTYLYINDAAAKHGLQKKENLIGKTMLEMYPGVEKTEIFAAYKSCMEERIFKCIESSFTFPDGTTNWYQLHIEPVDEGIFVISKDITERKQMEETLQQNETEMKEAERIGKIGNWTWDIKTDTITWSPEYYHIFGFDPTQKPPKYAEHLKVYTPESATRLDSVVKKQTETGEPYEVDLEIAYPKSSCHWITARSETKRNSEGKIIGLRGTAQDITERKQVEEKLKELDRIKDDFLSVTAHELKSPITPIKAQAQLLLREEYGELNEEQKEAIEMILRNSDILNVLSGEVLDISKIRSGKFNLILENNDLRKTIEDAVGDMRGFAEQKNITLLFLPTFEMSEMKIDRARIQQMMIDLLNNAVKFTPENGAISVEMLKKENEVLISVKDSGIGIDSSDMTKIFDPFFQVDTVTNRKYRGTGLGLPIAKGIAEAHGGTIRVESEGENKGSTFIISLPIT
jgi:two-component system CheB/CheR fusion protein